MTTNSDQEPAADAPSNAPLKLAIAGLVVAVVLFGAAAVPVLRNRDNITADSVTTTSVLGGGTIPLATTTVAGAAPTSAPTGTADASQITTSTQVLVTSNDAAGATTTIVLPGGPTTAPTTTTPPTTTTTLPPSTSASGAGSQTTTTIAGASTGVPESVAVVKGGKIYLQGAVPDAASAQQIVDLAAEILGEQNVINEYVIDPRASDPNIGNIRVDDTVLFEPESAVIAPEFEPLLNQALALMTLRPSVTFRIVGHTDSRGSDDYNLLLSIARAQAVTRWLTDRGIDPDRLVAEGRGELEPIASNDTAVGREFNRRIQVFIENLLVDDN